MGAAAAPTSCASWRGGPPDAEQAGAQSRLPVVPNTSRSCSISVRPHPTTTSYSVLLLAAVVALARNGSPSGMAVAAISASALPAGLVHAGGVAAAFQACADFT